MNLKIAMLLIGAIILANAATASTVQVSTLNVANINQLNLSVYAPNLTSQIVIWIPSNVLNGTKTIDKITIRCGWGDVSPNGNLNVRILYLDTLSLPSNWTLIGSNYYNIPANTCHDSFYGWVTIILDTPIDLTTNFLSTFGQNLGIPIVPDLGIGIATTSTNGAAAVYQNKTKYPIQNYNFFPPTGGYQPAVEYINSTTVYGDNGDLVNWMPITLYGTPRTPTTPPPIPTPPPCDPFYHYDNGVCNPGAPSDTPIPAPGTGVPGLPGVPGGFDGTGVGFNNGSGTPCLNGTAACDGTTAIGTGIGNGQGLGKGTLPGGVLIGMGYDTNNDGMITQDEIISAAYDFSMGAFILSWLGIFISRRAKGGTQQKRRF